MNGGISIAVLGLGFGADFLPIYREHPLVKRVVIADTDARRLHDIGTAWGVPEYDRYTDLAAVLCDDDIDAVHLLAPVPAHAELTIQVLRSGKHCACAVPMATNLADIDRIIMASREAGTVYMMMETAVYAREYFALERLHREGAIGDLTLYRGFHIQNLDGFPKYWQGYPPMHYLTHALSPILALLDTQVERVIARGAGLLPKWRQTGGFDNPYPAEVGLLDLAGTSLLTEITVAFFQTGRTFLEGFEIFGENGGLAWPHDNTGPMIRYRMGPPQSNIRGNTVSAETFEPADELDRLPPELRPFTQASDIHQEQMLRPVHLPSHHGGSHPHLAHAFVSAIATGIPPYVDVIRAAEWTAPGIVAHASALQQGQELAVPAYR